MPPTKKRRLNEDTIISPVGTGESHEDVEMEQANEPDMSEHSSSDGEESPISGSEASSPDTEAEIEMAHMKKKSKKTAKRKIRATSPTQFGSTLEALLNTSVPTAGPLALKPSVQRRRKEKKDEYRSKKTLEIEKKEHEELGRITDVIGGWGGESERALRKIAQRGGKKTIWRLICLTKGFAVVQLFNVIQKAQTAKASEEKSKLALRGSGKPTLDAPKMNSKHKKKGQIIPQKEGGLFPLL